jgi:hypothetical protein
MLKPLPKSKRRYVHVNNFKTGDGLLRHASFVGIREDLG